MNYSIPVYSTELPEKVLQLKKEELDSVLDQQIIISQMAKGITFQDTENMDEYERLYVISKLIQLKKEENEAKQKAIEAAKARR